MVNFTGPVTTLLGLNHHVKEQLFIWGVLLWMGFLMYVTKYQIKFDIK